MSESTSRPRGSGTRHILPFEKLSPFDFERLCLWLVRREGFDRGEHLGASGSEQGRDILAWKNARRFAFQCKRTRSFGPVDARREIAAIRALPDKDQPDGVIFILTCAVSAKTRQTARELWGDPSNCLFWAGTELDEMVRRYPELTAIFFDEVSSIQKQASARIFVAVPAPLGQTLVGRSDLLLEIRTRLKRTDVSTVCALHGMPGVGKTALALAVAYDSEILAHFTGGVLWASLGPSGDAVNVLNRWGDALQAGGNLGQELDAGTRTQRILTAVHSRTEGRPILLIIDDVWNLQDANVLRQVAFPGYAWLVTTREAQLARSLGGDLILVQELGQESAEELLASRCPSLRALLPQAISELAATVGGLPLALSLIAGELNASEGQKRWMEEALIRLRGAAARLALENKDRRPGLFHVPNTLQAIVGMSLNSLKNDGEAAFASLGVFAPKPASFSRDAALAVFNLSFDEGDALLRSFVGKSLLENATEDRFTLHQILSSVSAARIPDNSSRERHAQHYLTLVSDNKERWHRIEPDIEQIRRAWSFLTTVNKHEKDVIRYAHAMCMFFHRRGMWSDCLEWNKRALEAAESIGSVRDRVALLNNLGKLTADRADPELALVFYSEALGLLDRENKLLEEPSEILASFEKRRSRDASRDSAGSRSTEPGEADSFQKRLREAWSRAHTRHTESLFIVEDVSDDGAKPIITNNIAAAQSNLGKKREALQLYLRALEGIVHVANYADAATIICNLAKLFAESGEKRSALEICMQALGKLGGGERVSPVRKATILETIGAIQSELGEKQEALNLYDNVLQIFRELGDRQAEAATLTSIAATYSDLGEQRTALNLYNQVLEIFKGLGDPMAQVYVVSRIALILAKEGRLDEAMALVKRSQDSLRVQEAADQSRRA